MSDVVVIHPVPTADGGYYVWEAAGERGLASTRDAALHDGHAYLMEVQAAERRVGAAFWDRVAQAHRWVRPRRAR
jgi:hypothetical protein